MENMKEQLLELMNTEEYKPLTSDPIDERYIEECKVYTENIIELSDDIIVYDLIKNDN